jgi:DNA-3-methyladenine glycosylase II
MNTRIKPLSPFSLDLSARRFIDGDPQIRRYEDGTFWQVIRVNDKLLLATVHALGTVDVPRLSVKLEPDSGLSRDEIKKAKEIIRSILNLDIDLKRFYFAVNGDRVMFTLTQQLCGLQSPATATIFEVLVDTITEQQISLKAAFALQRKPIRAFGDILKIDDKIFMLTPGQKDLLRQQ